MADLGQLEKMGSELKCPICLSLLKSAVSLGCNHIFCNLCILESMKSVSDCPVCKVPFRRREVRPAPHMDNLVSIYKSMEVASGVNIFATQIAPTTKNSEDGLARVNGQKSGTPETKVARRGKSKGKKPSCKRQKLEKADVRSLAKKRIHVTPFPVSETPMRPEKVSKSGNPSIELGASSVLDENKRLATDKQGDPLFSPFFWLREENDDDEAPEKLTARQSQEASPPRKAPCFSDIKDSDDDATLAKMTPTSKPSAAEAFDSEMFEWTQRACSPELCSTPLKNQTAGRHRLDGMQEKDGTTNSRIEVASCNEVPSSEYAKSTKAAESNVNAEGSRLIGAGSKIHKKKVPTHKVKRKCVKAPMCRTNVSSIDEVCTEIAVDSMETPKSLIQENEDTERDKPQSPRTKSNKRGAKSISHYGRKHVKNPMDQFADTAMPEALEQLPTSSNTGKNQNQDKEGAETVSHVLPCLETTNHILPDVRNKTIKRGKRAMLQFQKKRMKTSTDDSVVKTVEKVSATPVNEAQIQNQEYPKDNINLQVLSGNRRESKEPSFNGRSRRCKKIQKKPSELKERTMGGTLAVAMTKDGNKMLITSMETAEGKNNQTGTNCQKSNSCATKSSTKTKEFSLAAVGTAMRKCDYIHSQIQCAFCHSSNDTKASGEMLHYFNGKPVAADYNGGVNVIHSHKHCTEWAPDVYFEDDLAINLPAELARSRRIKCSCCGIKGAALGCYEKSCRKSFHFTCAKLTPECRWDNENFVMLCPLHLSSKLPNETSEPHGHFRKRSSPKTELQAPILREHGPHMSQKWRWPSGSPCKWVLCCSALTVAEKEIVSEFARLTGASISKTWTPAVTHVIASTDVNGACRRTLKFLMGILVGKWILGIDWIKACMKVMEPVDEEKFEITLDIHGVIEGPRQGRLRITNKQPKLFNGFRFYLAGDFQPSYKGYLQDLVIAAGGSVLQRKPISRDQEKLLDDCPTSKTLIIYSLEFPEKHKRSNEDATLINRRRAEAQALADACGAQVAANSWILDSIAACKLQSLA